jgi:hypothetical protein
VRIAALLARYTLGTLVFAVVADVDPAGMIGAPSRSKGNAFCTANKVPLTLMAKVRSYALL